MAEAAFDQNPEKMVRGISAVALFIFEPSGFISPL
jgi:hypothetical protein